MNLFCTCAPVENYEGQGDIIGAAAPPTHDGAAS